MATDLVPFSPVPSHQVAIPFRGDAVEGAWSAMTYTASPLRVLWEESYRQASLALLTRDVDTAEALARQGLQMEDAYILRTVAESRKVAA